jgi:hypothetical protein
MDKVKISVKGYNGTSKLAALVAGLLFAYQILTPFSFA